MPTVPNVSERPAAAREFYPRLFGLDLQDISAPGFDYTTLLRGEEPVAGIGGGAERRLYRARRHQWRPVGAPGR